MARRFTLLDGPYYVAMQRVAALLEHAGYRYCLVGGGAAQAWIASLRTGAGQRRLSDEPTLASALRHTRDLDFSTRASEADMIAMLNELASATGAGTHVLGARALRLGAVSVAFTLTPDDLTGMRDLYDVFLDSRVTLRLRRDRTIDEIPTIGLEALLVTKLTRRGDKAKDILDVTQILMAAEDAGQPIDLAAVRRMLGDSREALALLDEVRDSLGENQ